MISGNIDLDELIRWELSNYSKCHQIKISLARKKKFNRYK
uniref:Uncharacterized protein n=1 Tax=Arundo donax TaxID=35708 RepID=A0A0A9G483_ARUDO